MRVYVPWDGRRECPAADLLFGMGIDDWAVVCPSEQVWAFSGRWGSGHILSYDKGEFAPACMDNLASPYPYEAAGCMAAAADCEGGRVWLLSPNAEGLLASVGGERVQADADTFEAAVERAGAYAEACGLWCVGFSGVSVETSPEKARTAASVPSHLVGLPVDTAFGGRLGALRVAVAAGLARGKSAVAFRNLCVKVGDGEWASDAYVGLAFPSAFDGSPSASFKRRVPKIVERDMA